MYANNETIKKASTSVIRQKVESQNGCFKKTKHTKFSEKRIFGVLCFLETPVLRFSLLRYYRQVVKENLRLHIITVTI